MKYTQPIQEWVNGFCLVNVKEAVDNKGKDCLVHFGNRYKRYRTRRRSGMLVLCRCKARIETLSNVNNHSHDDKASNPSIVICESTRNLKKGPFYLFAFTCYVVLYILCYCHMVRFCNKMFVRFHKIILCAFECEKNVRFALS